jgi:hypothetical protein
VSLSNELVINLLNRSLVCGFKNIKDEPYCGKSGHHDADTAAVNTTNGAGPHNVQIFILNSEGIVLNCLPGYWAPQDLKAEILFALRLNRIWHEPKLTLAEKKARFSAAHLMEMRSHSSELRARSKLTSFDAAHEMKIPTSDFHFRSGDFRPVGSGKLKSTDQVLHERMAKRQFLTYEQFDTARFVEYGKLKYDKHEERRETQQTAVKAKKK